MDLNSQIRTSNISNLNHSFVAIYKCTLEPQDVWTKIVMKNPREIEMEYIYYNIIYLKLYAI